MKPFRYLTDVAYVVPALRSHSEWPKMNRRKVAIVVGVLSAHAALIWTLVNMAVNTPPPIEFVETQVVLEQVTQENPVPTAIPPSPKAQQKIERQQQVKTTLQQARQVHRVNDNAVVKDMVKESAQEPRQVQPQVQPQPAPQEKAATPAQSNSSLPNQSVASAHAGNCRQVIGTRGSGKSDVTMRSVQVHVKRDASGRALWVKLISKTGSSSLDAAIIRTAKSQLKFIYKAAECEGVEASLMTKVEVPNDWND